MYSGGVLSRVKIKKSKSLSKLIKPWSQRYFVYTSQINLGWKWLALFVITVSIIQLPLRKGVRYGFNVPSRYKKITMSRDLSFYAILRWFVKFL